MKGLFALMNADEGGGSGNWSIFLGEKVEREER